jgi:signal transduction histidine kinase
MKKDSFIKFSAITISINLLIYFVWVCSMYALDLDSKNLIENRLHAHMKDLYKLSQTAESIASEGVADCFKISSSDNIFLDATIKTNCRSYGFIRGFPFTKNSTEHQTLVEFRVLNKAWMIQLFYSILILANAGSIFFFAYLRSVKKNHLIQQSEIQEKVKLSQQLAHDIRSPLSTLNILASKIDNSEIQDIQKAVTKQISDMSNDYLKKFNSVKQTSDMTSRNVSIDFLFENLKNEFNLKANEIKREIIFIKAKNINLQINEKLYAILYAVINNGIQNSIEATLEKHGKIQINFKEVPQKFIISIEDNGSGITEDDLALIGNLIFTTKKDKKNNSGNGIALYNAKQNLLKYNCFLNIQSQAGLGTYLTITIPT